MSQVKVTLPDGSTKEVEQGMTIGAFVATHIGAGLAKASIAAKVNGTLVDLSRTLDEDASIEIVTNKTQEGLDVARHSAAHVMASVVQRLFPGTQVTIGPTVEDGFYYDFYRKENFTPADLEVIERETNKELAKKLAFIRKEVSADEAKKLFQDKGETFKLEIIDDIVSKGATTLTLYQHGDWVDFCRGPHVPSSEKIGVVKLMSVAGAYWRGKPGNPMLQRIYGTAFFNKKDLEAHLTRLEEAKKRDHRRLGPQLGLFAFHEYAPGAAFWLPKGSLIVHTLQEAMRNMVLANGYQEVHTPLLFNKKLWETSGHWGKYKDNMFLVVDSESDPSLPLEERCTQSLKPMNCPSHHLMYRMAKHSYRELPIRYFTTDVLHRNEASGTLSGLTRVRQFQQDDSHIYLSQDQVTEEVGAIFELMKRVYGSVGLPFEAKFSTRPEMRLGSDALWDRAEGSLKDALESTGLEWSLHEGDGAFYGPKIDFVVTDSLGRKWQLCTIQLDYLAPERFDLTYTGSDNDSSHRPVVIHRAIFGSFERFIAILLEHFAGAFPAWLAPIQARLVTVAERHNAYAEQVGATLRKLGYRIEVDTSNGKLGAKIRDAQLMKIPYTCIIGDKEVETGGISPRRYAGGEDLKTMPLQQFVDLLKVEAALPFGGD